MIMILWRRIHSKGRFEAPENNGGKDQQTGYNRGERRRRLKSTKG
jgi:hypothetical protein